jgi:hypothetical protein
LASRLRIARLRHGRSAAYRTPGNVADAQRFGNVLLNVPAVTGNRERLLNAYAPLKCESSWICYKPWMVLDSNSLLVIADDVSILDNDRICVSDGKLCECVEDMDLVAK